MRLGLGLGVTAVRRAGVPAVDLLTGLEAYYRFEGDLEDASGNGRVLTNNGPAFGAGVIGAGLADGGGLSDPVILTGVSPATGEYTAAAWVQVGGATPLASVNLIDANEGYDVIRIGPRATGVRVVVGSDVTDLPAAAGWHHVAQVVGGGQQRVYLDGALAAGPTSTAAWVDGSTGQLDVQATGGAGTDEVGVWSRALSADEIASLYNGGAGFDPTA